LKDELKKQGIEERGGWGTEKDVEFEEIQ